MKLNEPIATGPFIYKYHTHPIPLGFIVGDTTIRRPSLSVSDSFVHLFNV